MLIDALYEAHVRLVMLASHEVLDLLPISAEDKEGCDYDEVRRLIDCLLSPYI